MQKLLRTLLFGLAALLLALMVGALALQVIAREMKWAVDWTEELGRFAFISMAFIAAAHATLARSHLRVSVVSDQLIRLLGGRAVHLLHSVILAGFAAVMVVFSWLNLLDGIRYPNTSPALDFNQNYLFIAMFAGFLIIGLLHLADIVRLVRGGTIDE